MRIASRVTLLLATAVLSSSAFAGPSPPAAPVTAATVSHEPVTDAQILGILDAVNLGEIDEGEMMVTRATHPEVKKFAQRMVDEHTIMTKRSAEIAKKAKITPADSKTKTELQAHMRASMAEMKGEAAAQTDRHYIDHSVMAHQQVLDMLDGQLAPNAKSADVKAFLADARAKVAMHLQEAKRIQVAMGGGATLDAGGGAGPTGTGSSAQGSPPSPMPTPTGPSSPAPMPSPSPSPLPSPTPAPGPSPTPLPTGSSN